MDAAIAKPTRRTGMKVFFAGALVSQLCALLRYVVLARILGPDQLGLAAILILTSVFLELLTEGGIATYLIQSKDGEDPNIQAMVQLVNLVRCAVMAAALLALAAPLASFYDRPELANGVRWLALSPIILAFLHYDVKRVQRSHNFGPEGWMMIGSETLALAASAILALLTHSFYAVALGLAGRSLAMVLVSHVLAERPFRLGFAAASWVPLRNYSWPLIIDGLFLFIGQQGDRLLIGKLLGVAELGIYMALLLLIYYPTGLINKLLQGVNLPRISQGRHESAGLDDSVGVLGGHYLLAGLIMFFGYCATMPLVVPLLFGQRFEVTAYAVALVGLLQTTRFVRGWPTIFALAMGRSRQVMFNNVLRMLAFPFAVAGQWTIGGLAGILIGFALGEVIALVLSAYLVDRSCNRDPSGDLIDIMLLLIASMTVCAAGYLLGLGDYIAAGLAWITALAAGIAITFRRRAALRELRPLLAKLIRRRAA